MRTSRDLIAQPAYAVVPLVVGFPVAKGHRFVEDVEVDALCSRPDGDVERGVQDVGEDSDVAPREPEERLFEVL